MKTSVGKVWEYLEDKGLQAGCDDEWALVIAVDLQADNGRHLSISYAGDNWKERHRDEVDSLVYLMEPCSEQDPIPLTGWEHLDQAIKWLRESR